MASVKAASRLPRCTGSRRANPKTGERRSLRKIAAELAKIGGELADAGTSGAEKTARAYFASDDQPYSAKSVRAMLRHVGHLGIVAVEEVDDLGGDLLVHRLRTLQRLGVSPTIRP